MASIQAIVTRPTDSVLVIVSYQDYILNVTPSPTPSASPADLPRNLTFPYPEVGDSFTIYRTYESTTFLELVGTVQGTDNPAVTVGLSYGTDRNNINTTFVAPIAITDTSVGQILTLQNQPIPPASYITYTITAISGTVKEFHLAAQIAA